jgi:hypothetical protein
MHEFRTDPIVDADAPRDLLHVCASALSQIGDLMDKGDLGGEKRVGCVFDQFRGAPTGVYDRSLVEVGRSVNFSSYFSTVLIICADNDAVRVLEIPDGSALTQKLEI